MWAGRRFSRGHGDFCRSLLLRRQLDNPDGADFARIQPVEQDHQPRDFIAARLESKRPGLAVRVRLGGGSAARAQR